MSAIALFPGLSRPRRPSDQKISKPPHHYHQPENCPLPAHSPHSFPLLTPPPMTDPNHHPQSNPNPPLHRPRPPESSAAYAQPRDGNQWPRPIQLPAPNHANHKPPSLPSLSKVLNQSPPSFMSTVGGSSGFPERGYGSSAEVGVRVGEFLARLDLAEYQNVSLAPTGFDRMDLPGWIGRSGVWSARASVEPIRTVNVAVGLYKPCGEDRHQPCTPKPTNAQHYLTAEHGHALGAISQSPSSQPGLSWYRWPCSARH